MASPMLPQRGGPFNRAAGRSGRPSTQPPPAKFIEHLGEEGFDLPGSGYPPHRALPHSFGPNRLDNPAIVSQEIKDARREG
jgi:hypothetical protein